MDDIDVDVIVSKITGLTYNVIQSVYWIETIMINENTWYVESTRGIFRVKFENKTIEVRINYSFNTL